MSSFLTALAAIVGLVGGGVGITAVLTIKQQRKLLGATAHGTDVSAEVALSESAMARMKAAEDRAERAERKADENAAEMQRMRRKFFAYELWADQHQVWDGEAMAEVNARGGHLRPPPQLVMINEG